MNLQDRRNQNNLILAVVAKKEILLKQDFRRSQVTSEEYQTQMLQILSDGAALVTENLILAKYLAHPYSANEYSITNFIIEAFKRNEGANLDVLSDESRERLIETYLHSNDYRLTQLSRSNFMSGATKGATIRKTKSNVVKGS